MFFPAWIPHCLSTSNLRKAQIRSMHSSYVHLQNVSFRFWWAFWNENIINWAVGNEERGRLGHVRKTVSSKRGNSFKLSSSNQQFVLTSRHSTRGKLLIQKLSACHLLLKVDVSQKELHKKKKSYYLHPQKEKNGLKEVGRNRDSQSKSS